MLNDLYAIERSMAAGGMGLSSIHPDIKDMAKGPAFRLRLDSQGCIVSVELIADAGRGEVWTLRDGQHNGFPGLKTKSGLLRLSKTDLDTHISIWKADKSVSARRAELRRLMADFPLAATTGWPEPGHRKRISQRFNALNTLSSDPLTASVPAAFERFLIAVDASPPLLAQLAERLHWAVANRSDEWEWLETIRAALTGQVALAIDVPVAEFSRNAGDKRQIEPISRALAYSTPETSAEGATICALSGKVSALHSGNFPQPNLPGLGQTYIFSRNSDIPSLGRYGKSSDESFAIGVDLVRRLSGVLAALTKPEAEKQTWALIPAEKGDKPDLLVTSLNCAQEFLDDEIAQDEATQRELGARLHRQFDAENSAESGGLDEMSILVLRTVDPANRKAIYHRKTKVKAVAEAFQRWRLAMRNVPDWVALPMPENGKSGLVPQRPPYVAPLSLTPLSRALFANGGRRRVTIIGVSAAEAFGLYLNEGDVEQRASNILALLLLRHGPLLSGLSAAKAKGSEALKTFDPKLDLRRDALRTATWIGALLHFIDRTKEVYMSGIAFRLGQLLSAADFLHIGYCADLRGGAVPPTLVGNSVFAIAGADPTRALAVLSQRLKPYLAWATSGNLARIRERAGELEGKDKNRAFAMRRGASQARRTSDLARELKDLLEPYTTKQVRPDDAFRAELLLGYLAGLPAMEKAGTVSNADMTNATIAESQGDVA